MDKEEVEIEIFMSAEWWLDPPKVELWLDDEKFADTVVTVKREMSESTSFKWKGELGEGEHTIKVCLKGKNLKGTNRIQTITDENGNIVKDQLLHMDRLLIDNIDLGDIVRKVGVYNQFRHDGYDHEPVVTGRSSFGVNGELIIKFSVPTYMWLLENI